MIEEYNVIPILLGILLAIIFIAAIFLVNWITFKFLYKRYQKKGTGRKGRGTNEHRSE